MNLCDDDEKENEKEKDYKSVSEISFSTIIIEIIIIIIIIVIIIIIEKDEYEDYVDHLENFDCLFVCSVEFFDSLPFLKEEEWDEDLKFVCEKSLKEEFVCVVCLFAELFVFENVHFDCELCDSILIFSLLFVFESVASSIFSSILENLASENQSSVSFSLMRKKEFEIERKNVFISCSFVCIFINSSIEDLFALVFFVSESSFVISFERSSASLNSKKCEIVQRDKKFLEKFIIIDDDVTSSCATCDSNFSSQNKNNRVVEEKEKKLASRAKSMRSCVNSKENSDWLRSFTIDFAFDCLHVKEIEDLLCVILFVETEQKHQKEISKKKKKKRMSFEIFNEYRKSRSISNENNANLTQKTVAKRELSKSTSREKKAAFVVKKIVQIRSSTTISSLQVLQMLSRWLIIMSALETFETFLFDEYNITKFLNRYANLCQDYDLEEKEKFVVCHDIAIWLTSNTCESWLMRTSSNEKSFAKLFVKIIKTKILISSFIL